MRLLSVKAIRNLPKATQKWSGALRILLDLVPPFRMAHQGDDFLTN